MKKYIQNIWMRLIACFLCVVSVLGLGVGGAATLFFFDAPAIGDALESGYEKIMLNYALYGVDYLDSWDEGVSLEDTNLYMTIEKLEYLNDTMEEPVVTKRLSNMPEGMIATYTLPNLYASSAKYYNTNSLLKALRADYITSPDDLMVPVNIDGYVFDAESGVFYYQTKVGYFEVDYVYVAQGGLSYDYSLIIQNGKYTYYNSYYEKTLDCSRYREWEWIRIGDKKMGIAEAYQGNSIRLITNSSAIEGQVCTKNYYVDGYKIYYVSDRITTYRVSMAVADPLEKQDLFWEYKQLMETVYSYQNMVGVVLGLSFLLLIAALVLLAVSAPENKMSLRFFHKIPVLILTAGMMAIEAGIVYLTITYAGIVLNSMRWNVTISSFVVPLVLLAACFLWGFFIYVANIITRVKTKSFFRYSEFYYLSLPLRFLFETAKKHTGLFWKGVIIISGISLVEAFLLIANQHSIGDIMGWFLLGKGIEFLVVLYVLIQMKALKDGAKRVAAGDLTNPINTSHMFWEFKEHADNINQVSDGIALAVEEQMKSERFKTELITNVSHDIKTPLTSIINYVDLMKKEEITDSTMIEYVEVLDRQSARLKKLIEDLMEASKASTGNLEVNLEECDMGVLLSQVVGEFEDKLAAGGLEAVVNKPEEPVKIMADGRHIWRVLDNLMNNVCKYSQENTRVYVSLEEKDDKVQVVFKNISKTALNIPSDQLMQRFVRGDSSRHTEGSGLGLSIAQSLTELMNGTMKLDIDGDLFKVILKFDRIA